MHGGGVVTLGTQGAETVSPSRLWQPRNGYRGGRRKPWKGKTRKSYSPHISRIRNSNFEAGRAAGRHRARARKICISVCCGEPVRFPPWDAVKNGRPPGGLSRDSPRQVKHELGESFGECAKSRWDFLNPSKLLKIFDGAQKRTRTSTPLRAPAPEAGASTNSAIWARGRRRLIWVESGDVNRLCRAIAIFPPAAASRGKMSQDKAGASG